MREGWEYKKLGSFCKTGAGGTPLKSKKENYENGTIPWLRSGEVNNRNITNCEIRITETGLNNSSAKLFPPRTVLIAMYGATAGQVGILNFECSTNQAVCGILPNENFVPEFLYYFFLKFKEELIAQAVGGAQPNISQQKIKNTLIPNITLEEQKQIVTILDKAFTAIDQAKANIEKNIENAKELFQSKLNNIFSQKGDGWEIEKMVDVCSILTCGVASTPKYVDEAVGVPFLSAQNVKNGKIILHKYKYISQEFHKHLTKKNKPQKGDILYSRVGAKFGEAGVVEHDFDFSVYVSVTLIRPLADKLNNYYLKYYLNSPLIKSLAKSSITSSGVPNLNVKTVREFPVHYPSIKKQLAIVKEIQNLEYAYIEIHKKYKQKINSIEDLKKSILQKAFAGELTENAVVV
ncbi:hypothetical protein GH721_14490 [Kriegella sp. EG-1]|nr:hypothetical protein [Flavobacteriaceae bacterium EG-1]